MSDERAPDRGPRVVILGGGFGGLACARRLVKEPVDVTLVDRRDYHQFTPLLYQVASALLTAPDIAFPLRRAFRAAANVHIRHARATAVDLDRGLLRTSGAGEIPFDYLVLAAGSENDYFGNPGLAAHTLGMKKLPEAQRLRNHLVACLERAVQIADQEERRRCLTFVVVGGGPTGVEFTGALVELLKLVLGREYRELSLDSARVVLIEGTDRLLPALPEGLGRYARKVLERRGVEVLTGHLVESATAEGVVLAGGQGIASRTVVWSAGIRATELDGLEGVERTRAGRLLTDERLRLPGYPRVYAVGDLAALRVDGAELPMLAPVAMQEGRYAARSILAEVKGSGPPPPFRYRDRGVMAVIGRNAAVAAVGRLRFTGALGWLIWLVVHLYYLIGFRNRVVVLLNWGWNYVRKDRPIRMITHVDPDPLADDLTAWLPAGERIES